MLTRTIDQSLQEMPEVERLGVQVSSALHNAVLEGGEATRNVADVLHGTWLGHPLHPVLTDVTIGAWMLGAAFDAVGALANDSFSRRVGDRLTAVGTASALPTAVAGLADYSTIPKPAVTPATVHALTNSVGVGLYLLSLRDRKRGRRKRGLLFSTLAMTAATAGAWLGGKLVYEDQVGVDHRDDFSEPEDWMPVLDEAELPESTPKCVQVEGKGVLLYRDGSEVYAIGSVCAHAGGPLEKGDIDGPYVECPWHQSVFDLRDGSITHGPATLPQPNFEARVHDGKIEIRRPREGAEETRMQETT
jgi:nitrite reductase/ring-hydroxylating ferredoxin subunit/uncharacterized membrane protein